MFDLTPDCLGQLLTRRRFLRQTSCGLGVAALASLLESDGYATVPLASQGPVKVPGILGQTHFAPKAKNVIYLFMGGGPSHIDLYDHKPKLRALHGHEIPKS